jgi:hypothetical protein
MHQLVLVPLSAASAVAFHFAAVVARKALRHPILVGLLILDVALIYAQF